MAEILKAGPRLRLRRAEIADIDYICALQAAEENSDYIVPFSREDHERTVTQAQASMDLIVEEVKPEACGYALHCFAIHRIQYQFFFSCCHVILHSSKH